MTVEVAMVISIISVTFSVIFGMVAMKRNQTSDIEQRAEKTARMMSQLDTIQHTTTEIKEEFKDLKSEVSNLNKRVTIIETKVDKAHVRIDELQGK